MSKEFWGGLILAVAYLGRESVCINALMRLWFAKAINDRNACSIFNYMPDLHGQEMHPEVAGKWPAARESWKFHLNSTSSIPETSLSNHSIDCWWTFQRGFCISFATAQSWPKMLICNERESVKYGDFPDQSKWFHIFARSSHCWKLHEVPKQTTSSLTGLTAN